jgi:hypothetical protein
MAHKRLHVHSERDSMRGSRTSQIYQFNCTDFRRTVRSRNGIRARGYTGQYSGAAYVRPSAESSASIMAFHCTTFIAEPKKPKNTSGMLLQSCFWHAQRLRDKYSTDTARFKSLTALIDDERRAGRHAEKFSCTRGLLWLTRYVVNLWVRSITEQQLDCSTASTLEGCIHKGLDLQVKQLAERQAVLHCKAGTALHTGIHKDVSSCRGMQLVVKALHILSSEPTSTPNSAARIAYSETLKPFHGFWATRAFQVPSRVLCLGCAQLASNLPCQSHSTAKHVDITSNPNWMQASMLFVPSRHRFMASLSENEEESMRQIRLFAPQFGSVLDELHRWLVRSLL